MKLPLCAADDCRKPFEPAFGQEEQQKYCSPQCGNRARVRLCRARKRYGGDNGGGPGGKRRQPMLFSKLARKPKPEHRVKQDQLFPDDGATLHATFGGAVEYATDGSASDKNKYSVKCGQRIPPTSVKPEADLAA